MDIFVSHYNVYINGGYTHMYIYIYIYIYIYVCVYVFLCGNESIIY